jgi:rare lipoprotein A
MSRRIGVLLSVTLAIAGVAAWRFGLMRPPAQEWPLLKASIVEEPKPLASERKQVGRASWYLLPSKTANGEQMNEHDLTAAHPTLPFGTKVEIENLHNGRKATVRVNDRGPFVAGRIIDISKAAANTLDMIGDGIATVRIQEVKGSTE